MKKTVFIGRPNNPSKVISFDTDVVTKFVTSWGGGMGGSTKSYYATDFTRKVEDGEITYDLSLTDGMTIEINASYVVSKQKKNRAVQVTDSTEFKNHCKVCCKKYIVTQHFIGSTNDILKPQDKYDNKPSGVEMIHKHEELTPLSK